MLKKNHRLSSVRLDSPNLVRSHFLNIKTAKNSNEGVRFGFVISKKLDKRAVVRNQVKRKLSTSIEEIFDRIKDGRDFVFYPKRNVLEIDQKKLSQEVEKLFKKEGFLNV